MKRQILALLALTSIVTSNSLLPAPAKASTVCQTKGTSFSYNRKDFQSWEHPFVCDHNIGKMTQGQANAYCKTLFGFHALGTFLMANGVPRNPHIWGHLDSRLCVYNTKK
ncbi:MAG: hypothetical protein C4288_15550 [Leptolyngbya sp. ERB_1_1]